MNITQNLTLDFYRNDYKNICVKQYDKDSRVLLIKCTNNGREYKLNPNKQTCRIKMMTPDARPIYNDATINEDGTVTVIFTDNMLYTNGQGVLELEFTEDGTILSTMLLNVSIVGSSFTDEDVIATDKFSVLSKLVTDVENIFSAKKLKNRYISISDINTYYLDIKDELLYFAYGFVLTNGINTSDLYNYHNSNSNVISLTDDVSLYIGNNEDKYYSDYIYYDNGYKLIKQVNTNDYTQLGYTTKTEISLNDNLINKILLPFELGVILDLIYNNKYNSLYTITYSDCGAYLNGNYDDRPFIECCHRIANKYSLKVEQHYGTIYIANSGYITVNGDMSLKGSTLLIDNYNRQGLYWLASTSWGAPEDLDYSELTTDCSYCTALSSGYPNYTLLKLTRPDDCIRVDSGTQTNISREELILMTYKGNIIHPPIKDADENTTYTTYLYPEKKTFIEGCTLDITVSFAGSALYFMTIEKSNVEIKDFYILPKGSTVKNSKYRGTVFTVRNSFNVCFNNIIGYNIAGQPSDSLPNGTSGYVFKVDCALGIVIKNCNVTGYWGCMGLNGVKDVVIDNSTLNRIDIHDYFRGLKISNCTILDCGIQIGYGNGQVSIINSTLVTSEQYFVELRTDYGNMFNGSITFNNNYIKYTGSNVFRLVDNASNFVLDALLVNQNTELTKPLVLQNNTILESNTEYAICNYVENENINYIENILKKIDE